LLANPAKVNSQFKLLWVGCGTDDTLFKSVQTFTQTLSSSGIALTYRETDGAHTWLNWRRYLAEVAPKLFPKG
jgi:enterochelin esterase-like enzyme